MNYYANMLVNGGVSLQKDLTNTSKNELVKRISHIARMNCFVGNEFSWKVWDSEEKIVSAGAGRKTENGFCFYNCTDMIGQKI